MQGRVALADGHPDGRPTTASLGVARLAALAASLSNPSFTPDGVMAVVVVVVVVDVVGVAVVGVGVVVVVVGVGVVVGGVVGGVGVVAVVVVVVGVYVVVCDLWLLLLLLCVGMWGVSERRCCVNKR